ncbi:DUF2306 domain-containing protein [Caulobacter endophyticus]|uniref:DUF2306 domain-containing protein n=1 Tax=Caulobacter endophyticus TaxID=2172652 RepID=UPI00241045D4|nr:DUF2306 domain-containing protein [Caulobacter endophyticus]MDG2531548.1 DUF2306 domain-containing protein [Caulobacter endophyticus]
MAFFGGTVLRGEGEAWNGSLPGLYDAGHALATFAIASHMAGGALLLALGPLQLVEPVRRRFPGFHRLVGKLYVACAGLAGAGGLAFILAEGTVGGAPMDLGFAGYGVLLLIAAGQTFRHARAGRMDLHRAWAIRLFALTIGSWLYRMEYGLWFALTGRLGHTATFDGWFDRLMVVAFYLPNLVVAELIIRRRESRMAAGFASALVLVIAALVLLATWTFTAHFWGPGIVRGFTGSEF